MIYLSIIRAYVFLFSDTIIWAPIIFSWNASQASINPLFVYYVCCMHYHLWLAKKQTRRPTQFWNILNGVICALFHWPMLLVLGNIIVSIQTCTVLHICAAFFDVIIAMPDTFQLIGEKGKLLLTFKSGNAHECKAWIDDFKKWLIHTLIYCYINVATILYLHIL